MRRTAAVTQIADRTYMSVRKIGNVNIIANARAVRRWIVGAENIHGLSLAERHLQRFIDELAEIGLSAAVARTVLTREGGLVALRFTVREAYDQTPGPQAGAALHVPGGATA